MSLPACVALGGAVLCLYNVLIEARVGVAGSSKGRITVRRWQRSFSAKTVSRFKANRIYICLFRETRTWRSWLLMSYYCCCVIKPCIRFHFSFSSYKLTCHSWALRSSVGQHNKWQVFLADCHIEVSPLEWCNDNICKWATMLQPDRTRFNQSGLADFAYLQTSHMSINKFQQCSKRDKSSAVLTVRAWRKISLAEITHLITTIFNQIRLI